MDHMMPEMDGTEAMRAIRAFGKLDGRFTELPIVVLTAHAVSGMREMFLKSGFDDFLSKPIDTVKLDEMLQRWIPAAKRQSVMEDSAKEAAGQAGSFLTAPVSSIFGSLAGAGKAELATRRLDLLNHYRWHFMNDFPTDWAYYQKFSTLVETMALENTDIPPHVRKTMADLASAGRRGDAKEIRWLLPDAYEAIAAAVAEIAATASAAIAFVAAAPIGKQSGCAIDTLKQLQKALNKGDSAGIDAAMDELRTMDDLSAPMRELYFFLYDALFMDETEKAAGGLTLWLNYLDTRADFFGQEDTATAQ